MAAPPAEPPRVLLGIRVDIRDATRLRRLAHDTLGDRIGLYVMATDALHGTTTLQL